LLRNDIAELFAVLNKLLRIASVPCSKRHFALAQSPIIVPSRNFKSVPPRNRRSPVTTLIALVQRCTINQIISGRWAHRKSALSETGDAVLTWRHVCLATRCGEAACVLNKSCDHQNVDRLSTIILTTTMLSASYTKRTV